MYRYFIIYKPYLVLSQFTTSLHKKTLADFYDLPKNIYPVGRLDEDSEGLLILTNDGALNNRLLHPSFAHEREYWVQVDGDITDEALQQLQNGVEINTDGEMYCTRPCVAKRFLEEPHVPYRNPPIRFRKNKPAPWIQMILHEGKNRQVRKMTAKVGFPTLRLIRYRISGIESGTLKPGAASQLRRLFSMSGACGKRDCRSRSVTLMWLRVYCSEASRSGWKSQGK